jgi:lycopene cyclase domain-containing protein
VVGAILLVLTAVFDSVMIAADLFRYDDSALLGVHVLRVPLEDLAWPVFAALALPALWELTGLVGTRVRR